MWCKVAQPKVCVDVVFVIVISFFVTHFASPNHGHYVSYVYNMKILKWEKFNDDKVLQGLYIFSFLGFLYKLFNIVPRIPLHYKNASSRKSNFSNINIEERTKTKWHQ
mgnify:CR=1 FL=1